MIISCLHQYDCLSFIRSIPPSLLSLFSISLFFLLELSLICFCWDPGFFCIAFENSEFIRNNDYNFVTKCLKIKRPLPFALLSVRAHLRQFWIFLQSVFKMSCQKMKSIYLWVDSWNQKCLKVQVQLSSWSFVFFKLLLFLLSAFKIELIKHRIHNFKSSTIIHCCKDSWYNWETSEEYSGAYCIWSTSKWYYLNK